MTIVMLALVKVAFLLAAVWCLKYDHPCAGGWLIFAAIFSDSGLYSTKAKRNEDK